MYKIRAIHLLTRPDDEREQKSIDQLSKLSQFGIEYKQIINHIYTQLPPKENCARPNDIAMEPGHWKLSPGHYGCHQAHKNGILENLTDDIDALLVFECDALLNCPIEHFVQKLNSAVEYSKNFNLLMWTFGPNYGYNVGEENEFMIINKFFECHAYLIPKHSKSFMFNFLIHTPWDVIDMQYAQGLLDQRMGVFKGPAISLQAKGYSFLDKKFSLKNALGMDKL